MSPNDLLAEALPLRRFRMVADGRLESKPGDSRRLHLVVALEEDCRRLPCPECLAPDCPIHDRVKRRWKHLNFWPYETIFSAQIPRVKCEQCGVHQVEVPWAREGSGFTLLFEAMAMLLSRQMSFSEVTEMLGGYEPRIWRVVPPVDQARKAADWSGVRRVAVDDVSRKRGNVYATNFLDLDSGELLFMAPGKDASTFEAFAEELARRGGRPGQIEELAMDMSKAFRRGAARHFPEPGISFDRFLVKTLVGETLHTVRRDGGDARGSLGEGGHVVDAGQRFAPFAERRRSAAATLPRLRGERSGDEPAGVPSGHLERHHPRTGRGASEIVVFVGAAQPPGALQEAGPDHPGTLEWHPQLLSPLDHQRGHRVAPLEAATGPFPGRGASATSATCAPSPTGSQEASNRLQTSPIHCHPRFEFATD